MHQRSLTLEINHRNLFKKIAKRYGLGYGEVPGRMDSCEDAPEVKENEIFLILPFCLSVQKIIYSNLLIVFESEGVEFNGTHKDATSYYINSHFPEKPYPLSKVKKIFNEWDKIFQPKESKKNSTETYPIFSNYQISIKSPVRGYPCLYPRGMTGLDDFSSSSSYSIILNFMNSKHLQKFLNGIPKEIQKAPIERFYAIYECDHQNSYQILILPECEYDAMQLFFGENDWTKDLPVVDFLLTESKKAIDIDKPFNDMQYSAIINLIQKSIEKQEKIEITDIDESFKKSIEYGKSFKDTFFSTKNYFIKNKLAEIVLKDNILHKDLTNIVMDYLRPKI